MSYFAFLLFLITIPLSLYALFVANWLNWRGVKTFLFPPSSSPRPVRPNKAQNAANLHKGHQFERYIARKFKKPQYQLIEWRSDKSVDGCFPVSSLNPDLVIESEKSGIRTRFAVECKWRSSWYKGEIEWARKHQIERYRAYQAEERILVYVAIGVGGRPEAPAELFVIPLDRIPKDWTHLKVSFLKSFRRNDFKFPVNAADLVR